MKPVETAPARQETGTSASLEITASGKVAGISAPLAHLLGREAAELEGKNWETVLGLKRDASRLALKTIFEECRRTGNQVSGGALRLALGSGLTAAFTVAPAGDEAGTVCVTFDAAAEPAGDENVLLPISRAIVSRLNQAVLLFGSIPFPNANPPVKFANRALEELTGYTAEDIAEDGLGLLFDRPADSSDIRGIEAALREGESAHGEVRVRRKNGSTFWAAVDLLRVNRRGKPENSPWVGVIRNISQRRMAEEQLENDKERLAVTLRSIGEGVITTNTEGRIEFVNHEGLRIAGRRQADVIGKHVSAVLPLVFENDLLPVPSPMERALRSGSTVGLKNPVILNAGDGVERKINFTASPIFDHGNRIIGGVLVFADISEKSKLERELQKSQKMESIAVLTGGIAHDFNNILTGILGNISLARDCSDPRSRVHSIMKGAERATLRAKDLTLQLLTFSKGGVPVKRRASIAALIEESADFILSGSNCRVLTRLPEDLWPVEVDEGQISQVVNNLLVNASQAMPDGGRIRVNAVNVEVTGEPSLPLNAGYYVKVSFSDEGCGIKGENLAKIFDPYFTTKKRGSGLGLATTYSVIKNHDGHIEVDSVVGRGTTFTFYLPAVPGVMDAEDSGEPRVVRGKGRVLVMDDEKMIQQIAGDMLEHLGYSVEFAKNSAEAERIFRAERDAGRPFDAVVLDLTVPGGDGGVAALQRLRAIEPKIPAVLTSGYANDPAVTQFAEHGFNGAVLKPYNIQQLSWAMNEALGEKPS